MKRFLAVLAALGCLAGPVAGETDANDFDAAMAGLTKVMEAGGDGEAIYVYLNETLQKARATGRINPDFAIFYAMFTDHVRNYKLNPGLALLLAEEGIAMLAGVQGQDDFRAILQVTLSYALADLGRLDEAFELAQLNMMTLTATLGEDYAKDYAADAALWGEGQLSAANTSANVLARDVLERAYARFEAGEFAGALSLASAALLPMDSGLPEGDVRGINVDFEWLNARALGKLGRPADSANAYLRALGYMTRTPWQPGEPPDWWGPVPLPERTAEIAFELFLGLADAASAVGRNDIQQAAIRAATPLAAGGGKTDLLMRQAVLATSGGDVEAAIALLKEASAHADATGDIANAHASEFYIALISARAARDAGKPIEPAPIIQTLDPLVALYRENLTSGEGFFLHTAAQVMLGTDAFDVTLDYARQALWLKQAELGARGDTTFGAEAARRNARSTVEVFLSAAHNGAAAGLDPTARVDDCDDVHRYVGCLVTYGRAVEDAPDE